MIVPPFFTRQRWLAGVVLWGGLAGATAPAVSAPAPSSTPTAPSDGGAVVVTADRLSVQTLIDRKVYTIAADLQSITGTVADVLQAVPSIELDIDGNLSLRGDSNVTVLVDGRPVASLAGSSAADALAQIPAQEIERIEVITNPPAQFKAEGTAGIINIVTKKARKDGHTGSVQANVGNAHRWNTSANGSVTQGRWSVAGSASFREDVRERIAADNRTLLVPQTGALVQNASSLDETMRRQLPSLRGTVDFTIDRQHKLSLTATRAERQGRRFFDQYNVTGSGADPSSDTLRHSDGLEWSIDTSQTLSYEQTFARPEEKLTGSIGRTAFHEREGYLYTNTDLLSPAPATHDTLDIGQDKIVYLANLDYVLPFSGHRKFKAGYALEDNHDGSDNAGDNQDPVTGGLVSNPLITNHFRYRQTVHAVYGTLEAPIGQWTLLGGLRLEHTAVDISPYDSSPPVSFGYARPYPSLHLERPLSDAATLSLSASRRVSRPDGYALDPHVDRQDVHNLRAGNPLLRPQDTKSFEIAYAVDHRGSSYSLTGYWRDTHDSYTGITIPLDAQTTLTTLTNLPHSRSGGMEFTANGHLLPRLGYNLSGNAFYNEIDATALGFAGLKSTTGVNAKLSLDFKATTTDTTQIALSRRDRFLTPQGYYAAVMQVNFGYRHTFSKELAAVVTVTDLFNQQNWKRYVETPELTDVYNRHAVGRVAYVGFVYTIGAPKKSRGSGFDYDTGGG